MSSTIVGLDTFQVRLCWHLAPVNGDHGERGYSDPLLPTVAASGRALWLIWYLGCLLCSFMTVHPRLNMCCPVESFSYG